MSDLNIFGKQDLLSEKELEKIFKKTLTYFKKDESVNLIFVSANKIKELNKKFRNKDKATDVLSFPYEEAELLGEIYIATVIVRKNAKDFGNSERSEMNKIFIHGLLHLFGFDHIKDKDAKIMEGKEEEILKQIKL